MNRNSGSYPAEVFGYPVSNRSAQAEDVRRRQWCPFTDRRCSKQSRLLNYPFGVCSVQHHGEICAICPCRFEERGSLRNTPKVLEQIALHYFGGVNNIVAFSEVGSWGAKCYWVIEEYIYANLVKRYGVRNDGYAPEPASRFALYTLEPSDDRLTLTPRRYVSMTVEEMYQAMRNNPDLPNKEQFVQVLNAKLRAKLGVKFG
jgi:hypothetical protein